MLSPSHRQKKSCQSKRTDYTGKGAVGQTVGAAYSRLGRILYSRYERQIAISPSRIETIADDEMVRDHEPAIVDLYLFADSRFGLVEESRELDRIGSPGSEYLEQTGERVAGIDDILDNDHVLATDRVAEVFEDLNVAGRFRPVLVARDCHEIYRHSQIDRPH